MTGNPIPSGALLTEGDHIIWLGTESGLDHTLSHGAESIDLNGGALLPGFWDSHLHLLLSAEKAGQLDLIPLTDLDQLEAAIQDFVPGLEPGAWLTGHGWDRATIFPAGSPPAGFLDRLVPDRPVFFLARDAHSAWLNQPALNRLSQLTGPPGEWQIQEENGRQTGLIFEDVLALQGRLVPPLGRDDKLSRLPLLATELFRHGITSVVSNETLADYMLYRDYRQSGGPGPRCIWNFCFTRPPDPDVMADIQSASLDAWLRPGGVKLFLDGSLGSRTAALDTPYPGTDDHGILVIPPTELTDWLTALDNLGLHGVFHTIGDRSTRILLECLGRGPQGGRRYTRSGPHHLEHIQFLSPQLLTDYDLSGLVFNMQPSHMWHDRHLGERFLPPELFTSGSYLLNSLRRLGTLCLGSDAPVETLDPWKGIEAAVSRLHDREHKPGAWIPTEALTLNQALAAHTATPASLYDNPFQTGSLHPGLAADLVIFPVDPFTWGEENDHRYWGTIQPSLTMQNGQVVWEK